MSDFRSIDPHTGKLVLERPASTSAEIDAALDQVARAASEWAAAPLEQRASGLQALAAALRARADAFATLMAEEIGKPLAEGRAEVEKCAWACEVAAGSGEAWLADEPVETDGRDSRVIYEPLGVVLAIMPWNFPFWQLFRFGASALLAGNTVLLKHAPNALRCSLAIAELFEQVGLSGRLVAIYATTDAVESLIAEPRVAAVTLTGSTRAGRAVAAAAGRSLKPCVLELGGSDPFVVLADADLDEAAHAAAQARLRNNGQSCIAAKRFIVERAVFEPFFARFRAELEATVMGDPKDPQTTLGPLARRDLRDALHGQVSTSIRLGARCIIGGEVPDREGFYYPPTLLTEVPDAAPIWEEETFGPVAAVRVVEDEGAAMQAALHPRYALGASLWTADTSRGDALARRMRAGAVFVNGIVRSDPRLPFGGLGESGWGRELGRAGMRAFTNPKTIWSA